MLLYEEYSVNKKGNVSLSKHKTLTSQAALNNKVKKIKDIEKLNKIEQEMIAYRDKLREEKDSLEKEKKKNGEKEYTDKDVAKFEFPKQLAVTTITLLGAYLIGGHVGAKIAIKFGRTAGTAFSIGSGGALGTIGGNILTDNNKKYLNYSEAIKMINAEINNSTQILSAVKDRKAELKKESKS